MPVPAHAWARSVTVIGLLAVAGSMRAGAQPPMIVAFT
jgi:hypothetical protein